MAQASGSVQKHTMFFNIKQKYPNVPDNVVSQNIARAGGDEKATEELLESTEIHFKYLGKTTIASPGDRSPEEAGAVALTPPRTPCTITRHVPNSHFKPRFIVPHNNGTSYPANSFSPNVEQSLANSGIHDLIQHQLRNKKNLELELENQNAKYEKLKRRVADLKSQLAKNQASGKIKSLTREISTLQGDCEKLNAEVDALTSVGGARGPIRKQTQVHITAVNGGEGIFTEAWHCEMCTFRNHYLLNQCETCCMPRINVGINAV